VEERGGEFALGRLGGVFYYSVSDDACGGGGGRGGEDMPSGKIMSSLNSPPSQIVFSLPGIPQLHFIRSRPPLGDLAGFAKNPNGWSLRHCLLCACRARQLRVLHVRRGGQTVLLANG
jgi:hypothetical protein